MQEISREQIAGLPLRRYEGEVMLAASADDVARAMDDLRSERVVGFDTETRPAFRKGESHLPCLAQAATARKVYLFPLQRLDCSAALGELLAASSVVKVGVGLADDLRQLEKLFPCPQSSVVDAGALARRHGVRQSGVRNLAGLFLGYRVPKGQRTSNWAATRLSSAQIAYAATDAWVCRELFLRFSEMGWVDSPQA